jgi:iron-sulfur cluster repair protein YtfE (RIC family)
MGMAVALNPKRDALELLRAEHRAIDRLLERFELLDPLDGERAEAAVDIGRELTYHTMLEHEIVLPAIEAAVESREARMALEVARLEIDMANALVERSETLLDDAVRLDAIFRVLIPLVRRHLSGEEANLFPALCTGDIDTHRMAAQICDHRVGIERAMVDTDALSYEYDD